MVQFLTLVRYNKHKVVLIRMHWGLKKCDERRDIWVVCAWAWITSFTFLSTNTWGMIFCLFRFFNRFLTWMVLWRFVWIVFNLIFEIIFDACGVISSYIICQLEHGPCQKGGIPWETEMHDYIFKCHALDFQIWSVSRLKIWYISLTQTENQFRDVHASCFDMNYCLDVKTTWAWKWGTNEEPTKRAIWLVSDLHIQMQSTRVKSRIT